ncbi:S1 family peptidase [Actinophytocola sediminis]
MGGTSRVTRLLLAALVTATGAVAVGAGPAGADERIVGGHRVSIEDHSYTVYLSTPDGFQYCGGTLVAEDKVVTAAHCTAGKQPADLVVVAGREDKESAEGTVSPVVSIWIHPEFTDIRSGADISVLTLADRLPYAQLPLADLADQALYQPGLPGLVLGWGRTAADGAPSQHLLGATVPIVADDDCRTAYPAYLAASMVCAGLPQGGVDSCQGDSGGPLVVFGVLIGITSWGEGCAEPGKPGVYTRIATYAADLAGQI